MARLRSIVFGFFAVSLLAWTGPTEGGELRAKLYLDAPGVYAVALDEVAEIVGADPRASLGALSLSHRGRSLPLWRVVDQEARERVVFLVPTEHFTRPWRRDGSSRIVLLLAADESISPRIARPFPSPARTLEPEDEDEDERNLPPVERLERIRRFERDLSRAPLDLGAAEAGVESWWYWTMISHQASSAHEIELHGLADRSPTNPELSITVGLLGWSDPRLPKKVPGHRVGVALDGERIGEATWSGRRSHEVEIPVPSTALRSGELSDEPRLTLKIPGRSFEDRDGDEVEIIDLVYVDWLSVRYRAEAPLADAEAPLYLAPARHPRRLAVSSASTGAVAVSSSGEYLARDARGGFVVPPSLDDEPVELWIVEPADLRKPFAIEPTTPGASDLPANLDYLMIAPRALMPGAERLADFHRGRGLEVAVVDAVAIYDAFGDGEKSPEAIRRFLDHQLSTSPGLRWVLLVGDADWLLAGDTTPFLDPNPDRRDRVPTFVEPSAYGPAASDHFYAADPADEANPRFAVGRLPVVDADELEAVVDKILAHVQAPRPTGPETLLLLSDRTRPSLGRREKLAERIAEAGLDDHFAVRRPEERDDRALDLSVIEALDQSPTVVHFGGHGSRHQWQLGETAVAGPETYFEREDVARLAPARRWPVAISISCATAPFDHPAADSLGEVMVLAPERGAIAFLGAGVRLYTPQTFSGEVLRALARAATLGEAVVAAKRAVGHVHVSRLYSLLGDPALPLR